MRIHFTAVDAHIAIVLAGDFGKVVDDAEDNGTVWFGVWGFTGGEESHTAESGDTGVSAGGGTIERTRFDLTAGDEV